MEISLNVRYDEVNKQQQKQQWQQQLQDQQLHNRPDAGRQPLRGGAAPPRLVAAAVPYDAQQIYCRTASGMRNPSVRLDHERFRVS